jgi:uncharacterized C2H2 Zn-finger protein
MPFCRRCGRQVGSNGFCFDCQSYNDVVDKLDDCDIDRLTTKEYEPLEVHNNLIEDTHAQESIIYSVGTNRCPICSNQFTSIKSLGYHLRKSHKLSQAGAEKLLAPMRKQFKKIKCPIPNCNMSFSTTHDRDKHIKTDHLNRTQIDELKE